MYIWTAGANERIYRHTRVTRSSKNFLTLESAKNAYVSGQILLRDICPFTISNITVSGELTNTKVYYQQYNVFNDGLPYPDELLDIKHTDCQQVKEHATQGIWISVYIPKETNAEKYLLNVSVETTAGVYTVPVYVKVYNVILPDINVSEFNLEYFFLPFDIFGYKGKPGIENCEQYGYERYSDKWWQLMEVYADCFKELRNNNLDIRILTLLSDAGTREVSENKWIFEWKLFDEFVNFFMNRKVVKKISCCSIIYPVMNDTISCFDKDSNIYPVDIESEKGETFANQFYSALYDHIKEMGLLDIFQMRLQDEPHQDKYWKWARIKAKEHMPGVKCGEPLDTLSVAKQLVGFCDQYIPRIEVYEEGADFFRERQTLNEEVWAYSCCFPEEHWYLNKFIDHPHIHSRLMSWACYSQNITGFLHWGFNYFIKNNLYSYMPDARFKGDGFIVYPNTDKNCVNISTRFISTRDGIQDVELMKIAERGFKSESEALSRTMAESFSNFNENPILMDTTVSSLLKLAEVAFSME